MANASIYDYFKYLQLALEDVREELACLTSPHRVRRVCDVGCGTGLRTFALSIELPESNCIGLDVSGSDQWPSRNVLQEAQSKAQGEPRKGSVRSRGLPKAVLDLLEEGRVPEFRVGNVVTGEGLPKDLDLVYANRLLPNLGGTGDVTKAITNIAESLRQGGFFLSLEYAKAELDELLEHEGLRIIEKRAIERHDIRSRGRTQVVGHYTLRLLRLR